MSGSQERIKLLLNQRDPATLGRLMAYYGYLNDYRGANIESVTAAIRELAQLRSEVAAEEARIAELARAIAPECTLKVVGIRPGEKIHEIMVSESLKPFLDPMVISITNGIYFSQSLRGEIVGGIGDAEALTDEEQGRVVGGHRHQVAAEHQDADTAHDRTANVYGYPTGRNNEAVQFGHLEWLGEASFHF